MNDGFSRLATALSDRYVIERELGAGGMATVYLAEDVKHHRKVAVKVLRPELSAVLGTERFQREIEIAARLNHPNILPLLDSGKADSRTDGQSDSRPSEFLYYVMPHVEGESLREKLNSAKQLPINDALEVTKQIASALDYAHRRDVVHRDIKPENILFHEGVAMVADFGIALAVKSAGGDRLTETGMSLGTPAYMSPEQVAGDRDIDGRSDVYSLACVLYEMLAGDPPFVASNPQAILAKHVTDPAPPITTVRSSVPQPVAKAIAKALGKARADRFESAKAFSEALFATDVKAEEEKKSIVVLPFENLSPDPEQEYFSDGLTEEVISDLSKVGALRVISRSSAMTFKGSDRRIPDIAKELNVRYALEGSVRKAGNNLRITAQLIDAANDAHVWSDKYTGTLDDVFEMQEKVSRAIVEALRLSLTPQEDRSLAARPMEDGQVYQWYLMARRDFQEGTKEGLERAQRHLEHAQQVLGENVVLLHGMAEAQLHGYECGVLAGEETLRGAEGLAERIFALQPDSAYGHYLKGRIERFRGSISGAATHFGRALALDPSHSSSLLFRFHTYGVQVGKPADVASMRDQVRDQDPLDLLTWYCLGMHDWMKGDMEEALCSFKRAGEMVGGSEFSDITIAYVLIWLGRKDEAVALIDGVIRRETPEIFTEWGKCLTNALAGDGAAALQALGKQTRSYLWNDPEYVWLGASTFALAGETDEALNWLQHAVDRGWINYPLFARNDPLLDGVRTDKRFKDLILAVKREWEEFKA